MIQVGPGVRLPREIALAVMVRVVEEEFAIRGFEAMIRSGIEDSGPENRHIRGSEHYVGHALDWRTKNMPLEMAIDLRLAIARRLGPDFDVILEANPPHLHTEWDPK